MDDGTKVLSWLPDLICQVEAHLANLGKTDNKLLPRLKNEREQLQANMNGWSQSLANPDLSPVLRHDIEQQYADALNRVREVGDRISEHDSRQTQIENIVDPAEVLARIDHLADVMAGDHATLGNLELSLHIDRIECSADGAITMRTCKLGALTGTVELVAEDDADNATTGKDPRGKQSSPRRRGRLRLGEADDHRGELRALADFAADTDRFAGLGDEWFWFDNFHIPDRPLSWTAQNAELVFNRRQEAKLSHAKLAAEFGVSKPTIRAAINHYLETYPDARDKVNLPSGGARPEKFDVAKFADEARHLWANGWTKLKLAEKYGCSTPIIDKALAFAYECAGLTMPTSEDRQAVKAAEARRLHDADHSLEEVVKLMNISDVTARKFLKASYAAEGKTMPDLRRRAR